MEPENNVLLAIEGYKKSKEYGRKPLIIVGKTTTKHGEQLVKIYGNDKNIRFVGGIYDFDKLNSIRHLSFAYFHGHSVGGTNPSLLEAMASGCFILAHANIFNKTVLGDNAEYYDSTDSVMHLLNDIDSIVQKKKDKFIVANIDVIRTEYSWKHLVDQHEDYFRWMLEDAKNKFYFVGASDGNR